MGIKIQIKTTLGKVIFEFEKENNSIRETLMEAIKSGVDLSGIDLRFSCLRFSCFRDVDFHGSDFRDVDCLGSFIRGVVFRDVDFRGSDFRGALISDVDFRGSDLRDVDFRGSFLRGVVFSDVDLLGSDFRGSFISDVDFRGALLLGSDFSGSYISDVDFRGSDLRFSFLRDVIFSDVKIRGSDLRDAFDIKSVKEDFFKVLDAAPTEVDGLLRNLRAGKINGSVYEGDCCCLVGTIANMKGCSYEEIPGLEPNASRPAERFFLSIKPGHTTENSKKCKEIEGWILEWKEKASVKTSNNKKEMQKEINETFMVKGDAVLTTKSHTTLEVKGDSLITCQSVFNPFSKMFERSKD